MELGKTRAGRTLLLSVSNQLARWTKPDPRLVLFGASNGLLYADNSQHLFEWMLINRPDLHPVWLTRSEAILNMLDEQHKPVAMSSSWDGFKLLSRAKVGVFTNSLRDLSFDPFAIPDSLRLIALRHGKSVKRVRFARLEHKLSDAESSERMRESALIEQAISTSEFISDIQEECLLIGRQKHVVTGYPRNDMLLEPSPEAEHMWMTYLNGLQPKKVVLYGPSWRHGREPTRFFPFDDFDKTRLVEFLRNTQTLLLLRPHNNDLTTYPQLNAFLEDLAAASEFIRVASHHVYADVNHLLPFVDVLISDYSALYHDFLLLDRPLMFVPYDYEEFARQSGFLYDYHAYLPGPAIASFGEFCDHLGCLAHGEDPYRQKRNILRDKVHQYQDAKSCQRVADRISALLKA